MEPHESQDLRAEMRQILLEDWTDEEENIIKRCVQEFRRKKFPPAASMVPNQVRKPVFITYVIINL